MKETLIFKTIIGSQAYGTSVPTSDFDYKGIYAQSNDDLISFNYKEQIEVGKDECYYEVRRFLQLAQSANPTILEMLYVDNQFIVETSPAYQLLRENRDRFLTKKCYQSFGGFAIAQIKKAKGLDKKMNWEKARVERKTPFDFCYVYEDGKTMPIEKWLNKEHKQEAFIGLAGLDHFRDCYAVYFDQKGQDAQHDNTGNLGFRGISLDDSNAIRVSSVPKGMKPDAILCFNKDGYSVHCKEFREYTTWLENRNTQRYVDIAGHNQQIDGKNLLHCRRLLDMAIEIATDKTIKVLRPNADYLLKIRRGEVPLDEIIEQAELDIAGLEEIFKNTDLPDSVDTDFVNGLLLEIRRVV